MAINASTKKMVGVAVLALLANSFNAYAEQPAHPILDTSTGATAYSGILAQQIANTGVPFGNSLAGGAVNALEAALKQPTPDARIKFFPAKPDGPRTNCHYR